MHATVDALEHADFGRRVDRSGLAGSISRSLTGRVRQAVVPLPVASVHVTPASIVFRMLAVPKHAVVTSRCPVSGVTSCTSRPLRSAGTS